MRTDSIWIALAVAIILLTAVAGALVAMFTLTNSAFVLGVLPVAAAIIVAAIQYRQAKDKETDARLFPQKQAAYTELINVMMELLHQDKPELTPEELALVVSKLRNIRRQIVIWGSSATLLKLDTMGSAGPDTSGLPVGVIKWTAELFSAIRKDLGHKDPPGAGMEMALGMLREPDRSAVRSAISAQPGAPQ